MKHLKSLYNGILNDHSIQRYSLNWIDIIEQLEKRFRKEIPRTDEEFSEDVLTNSIATTRGKLQQSLIAFAKEISISNTTLVEKEVSKRVGNHRSPFGIGS